MARVTNREKIIGYLKEKGIDILRFPWIEEKRDWQKPGTLVIHESYLTKDEQYRLWELYHKRYDGSCPIEIHDIRYHFEWQWGLKRISWKKVNGNA